MKQRAAYCSIPVLVFQVGTLPKHSITFLPNISLTQGTFLVCRAATRAMIDAGVSDGAIVNISSKAAQQPARGLCGYATAKGGIEALTRSMAMELAPHGIRCNCVAPGFTDTPNTRAFLPEEVCRVAEKASPLGRAALPEEVANVVAFLCCPESSYVIGNTVKVA
ncbi:hypothetical protein HPB48_008582 [Haemaphysalis longicornis]|uniref:Uncharacterized protein n=1 Tax=Haemaphysalis longicornis TaxID=44386 RepID=A0A9J6GWN5_HAELO|nr:hypothetical protein HPB48_008582 [Haemaphysalis longicornis]